MCLFSRAVERVSATRIFARHVGDDRQALIYAMTLATTEPVAMVLPLPVAPGSGEDAVRFVDLSAYPEFFADLDKAFPAPQANTMMFALRAQATPLRHLVVHAVGDFVASYVPTPADFERLDPRFRLPAGVLAAHAEYADWGFAVFQLAHAVAAAPPKRRWFWQKRVATAAPGDDSTIHPMAFTFPSRRPRALYFPTLHLHDGGAVPATASYDHTLYCQSDDPVLTRTFAWRASDGKLGKHVEPRPLGALVDPAREAFRFQLSGTLANIDHWFEPPRCAEGSLAARTEMFACSLAATAAYDPELGPRHRTARERLDELHAGVVRGLTEMIATHGAAWNLVPLPAELELHTMFLSNDQPHAMTERGPVPLVAGSGGTCVLAIHAESAQVEQQHVKLAFGATPSAATVAAANAAFADVLARAIT